MVNGRRPLVALLSAFFLLPTVAHASTTESAQAGPDRTQLRLTAQAVARSVGIPGRVYASGRSNPGSAGYVVPAADFNEDGVDDFLGIIYNQWADTTRIEAVNGKTGDTLFTKDYESYVVPLSGRVGESGTPGLVVAQFELVAGQGAIVAAAYISRTTLTALDGAGVDVWTKQFHGVYIDAFVLYVTAENPASIWSFDGLEGPASDIALRMYQDSYVPITSSYESRLIIIDGTDGSTAYEIESPPDTYEYYVPGPDIDADGLEDLFKIGRGRKLTAFSGTNGEQLWETRVSSRWTDFIETIGDVNDDGVDDIWTASYCRCSYDRSGLDAVVTGGTNQMLSGKNGRVIWTKNSNSLFMASDIDNDGVSDFASQDYIRGSRVQYSAFSSLGRPIYEKTYGLTSGSSSRFGTTTLRANIGDLDGDGVPDSYHSLKAINFSEERFYSHQGVISGADASLLRTATPKDGLNASLDGHGDDLYDIKRGDSHHTLSIFDGRDSSPLWKKTFPVEKKRSSIRMTPIDGRGGTELLINVYARVRSMYVFATYLIDGRTGETIWARF